MKKVLLNLLILSFSTCVMAEVEWHTHFSYANVEQIAISQTDAFGVANGALFSVNKTSEQFSTYDSKSGIQGSVICQIAYDTKHDQLLIFHTNGKMDVLHNGKAHYISDLYQKRMTASKQCHNVTIEGNTAYLSMDFGVLTFDLRKLEFHDTYYIGPEGAEVVVKDVLIQPDSIYAKTDKEVYCANRKDNLVDFHYWHTTSQALPFDTCKGKMVIDEHGDRWECAGSKGIYRYWVTGEEKYYLPAGPLVNIPYSLTFQGNRLYMVSGGRWATQYKRAGNIMYYENNQWTNIASDTIATKTDLIVQDMMNVAVDPRDSSHYFVSSYGTGLYEFRDTSLLNHYTPSNSILKSAVEEVPDKYTRLCGASYDKQGVLWVQESGVDPTLVAFSDSGQYAISLYQDSNIFINHTPGNDMIIDATAPEKKWMLYCRYRAGLLLLDDGGTPFDISDDRFISRKEFTDQDNKVIAPEFFYTLAQAPSGNLWVGTSNGPIIIAKDTDYFTSDKCIRLRIPQEDGSYQLESEQINAITFDKQERIWIGSQTMGIYVLDKDASEIVQHFTMDETIMPSNCILSLAYDAKNDIMYIGTGEGLVSCTILPDPEPEPAGFVDTSDKNLTYGDMKRWKTHFSYTETGTVALMGDNVYAISDGSLYAINKTDETRSFYNRENGLNGSQIVRMYSNTEHSKILLFYQDGLIDVLSLDGSISSIPDIYLKQSSIEKTPNDACALNDKMFLAMSFGIVVLNTKKCIVEDTYYIGSNASDVNIRYICTTNDSIYAVSFDTLYSAALNSNLIDFSHWKRRCLPSSELVGMRTYNNTLCLAADSSLWIVQNGQWIKHPMPNKVQSLVKTGTHLFAITEQNTVLEINNNFAASAFTSYGQVNDIEADGNAYWMATTDHGVVKKANDDFTAIMPDGPLCNMPYRLKAFGNKLYVLRGGRWASQYQYPGIVMNYENKTWFNLTCSELSTMAQHTMYDMMNVAQDPADATHYFMTSYGGGLIELKDNKVIQSYLPSNSPLTSAVTSQPLYFTRTDGAMYDDQGNLWVLNPSGNYQVHVIDRQNHWTSFNLHYGGSQIPLHTPGEIMVDKRNTQWKWIPECRYNTGLILLQDNGTPTNHSDDKVYYRNQWTDQNSKSVIPEFIYCLAQDRDNTIWVGTSTGLFTIPASVDFTTSKRCERIIIPRTDGSGLGDYLLGNEQINAIVVDGANRKWIGTAGSGLYLMSEDGLETIEHFTTTNSLMPSNNVLSIAIIESTGEVFIGTSTGLVSYMGDALEPASSYSDLYAFPNPVRPTYQGYVTIRGIMENTEVRITDSSGNLIKTIQGNGGEAIWDLSNYNGNRVATGVYTALCNTTNGENQSTVKILIMN